MAKKASLLPKIEVLILAVFFFTFVIWMVPKCAATKESYQEAEATEAAEDALLAQETAEAKDSASAAAAPERRCSSMTKHQRPKLESHEPPRPLAQR